MYVLSESGKKKLCTPLFDGFSICHSVWSVTQLGQGGTAFLEWQFSLHLNIYWEILHDPSFKRVFSCYLFLCYQTCSGDFIYFCFAYKFTLHLVLPDKLVDGSYNSSLSKEPGFLPITLIIARRNPVALCLGLPMASFLLVKDPVLMISTIY